MLTENYIIERIEKLCEARNMSRYRLAQRSGISQSSISNLLNRRNIPSIQTLDKLCQGLDITLAQFFAMEGHRPDLTEEQEKVLDTWSKLTCEQKIRVEAYIQGMRGE